MKHFYYACLTLLAAVMVLASCSKEKDGTACLKLIPEDAAIVVRIDMKQSLDAIGYDEADDFKDKLKDAINEHVDDDELQEMLTEIVDNPSATGIDTSNPVYLYVTANLSNIVGFVGTTSDQEKLEAFINKLSEMADGDEVEETDGVKYFEIQKAGIAFTDEWFFIGMAADGAKSLAKDLKKLAEADEAPIMKNEDFKAMMEKEGMFQMLVSGKGAAEGLNKLATLDRQAKEVVKVAEKALPGKIEDISLLFDGTMKEGISTGTAELLTYSDEWKEAVKDFDNMLGDIDENTAEWASSKGIAVLANIDGEKLFDMVLSAASKFGIDNDEETVATIRNYIASVKGDITFSMDGISDDETPELQAYISTKDETIIKMLLIEGDDDIEMIDSLNFKINNYDWDYNYESGEYEKTNLVNSIFAGFDRGYTYFVMGKNPQPFKKPSETIPSDIIQGKGFYFYFNYDFLEEAAKISGNSRETRMMKEMGKIVDYADGYYEGNGKCTFRGELNDKKTPLINQYVEIFEKFL